MGRAKKSVTVCLAALALLLGGTYAAYRLRAHVKAIERENFWNGRISALTKGMPKSDVEPFLSEWKLRYIYLSDGDYLACNVANLDNGFEFGLTLHVTFDQDGKVSEVELRRVYPT